MFWCKTAFIALASAGAMLAGTLTDAVRAGDRDAVQHLLQAHHDVNAADPDGTTALAWAVYADDLETARMLLRAGADAKLGNRYGVTPLSLAATNRNAAMAEALLNAGADARAKLPDGSTILM